MAAKGHRGPTFVDAAQRVAQDFRRAILGAYGDADTAHCEIRTAETVQDPELGYVQPKPLPAYPQLTAGQVPSPQQSSFRLRSFARRGSSAPRGSTASVAPSPPAELLSTLSAFKKTQADLVAAQERYDAAQEPVAELTERVEAAKQRVSDRQWFNAKYNASDTLYVEWDARQDDLQFALDAMEGQMQDDRQTYAELDIALRVAGEDVVDAIDLWLGTQEQPRQREPAVYDPPFAMELIESTEARCEEQEILDHKEWVYLDNSPFRNRENTGDVDCRRHLSHEARERLGQVKEQTEEKQGMVTYFETYKTNLEAGGPREPEHTDDFDLEQHIQNCKNVLLEVEDEMRQLVLDSRELGLEVTDTGTIVHNPFELRYEGGRDDDSCLDGDELRELSLPHMAEEMLAMGDAKVESWREETEFDVGPDDADPATPTTPNPDLIELSLGDSLSANDPEPVDLGYLRHRKLIDRWQNACKEAKKGLPEGLGPVAESENDEVGIDLA